MDERTIMDGTTYLLYVNAPTTYVFQRFTAPTEAAALEEAARILAAARGQFRGGVQYFHPDRYGWFLDKRIASNRGTGFELKPRSEW